jgi:hypothetical protein
VYRPAYALLVGIAGAMGLLAVAASMWLDRPLLDPEGFLGPAIVRLPLLILAAFLLDMLPRTLWVSRMRPRAMPGVIVERWRTHWDRERIILVILGMACFYITYVSYRNIKSYLPFIMGEDKYDRELALIDRTLFFGHNPGPLLHDLLGTGITAHFLSMIYLWFIPLVGLMLAAWLVWSRNITFGYWFATSQCVVWALGTGAYYMLPSMGPGFHYPQWFSDLTRTGSTDLMDALYNQRQRVLRGDIDTAVQSVGAFASLHVAVTLLFALMVQYTIRNRVAHWIAWFNFFITVIATIYFGWHYVADDLAGVVIALVSFWIGGLASGQKFDRRGLGSHPTSTTSQIPVDAD